MHWCKPAMLERNSRYCSNRIPLGCHFSPKKHSTLLQSARWDTTLTSAYTCSIHTGGVALPLIFLVNTPSNKAKWTCAVWVKRNNSLFSCYLTWVSNQLFFFLLLVMFNLILKYFCLFTVFPCSSAITRFLKAPQGTSPHCYQTTLLEVAQPLTTSWEQKGRF